MDPRVKPEGDGYGIEGYQSREAVTVLGLRVTEWGSVDGYGIEGDRVGLRRMLIEIVDD